MVTKVLRFWGSRPWLVISCHSGYQSTRLIVNEEAQRTVHYLMVSHHEWLTEAEWPEQVRMVADQASANRIILLHHKVGNEAFDRGAAGLLSELLRSGISARRLQLVVAKLPAPASSLGEFVQSRSARAIQVMTFDEYRHRHATRPSSCCAFQSLLSGLRCAIARLIF